MGSYSRIHILLLDSREFIEYLINNFDRIYKELLKISKELNIELEGDSKTALENGSKESTVGIFNYKGVSKLINYIEFNKFSPIIDKLYEAINELFNKLLIEFREYKRNKLDNLINVLGEKSSDSLNEENIKLTLFFILFLVFMKTKVRKIFVEELFNISHIDSLNQCKNFRRYSELVRDIISRKFLFPVESESVKFSAMNYKRRLLGLTAYKYDYIERESDIIFDSEFFVNNLLIIKVLSLQTIIFRLSDILNELIRLQDKLKSEKLFDISDLSNRTFLSYKEISNELFDIKGVLISLLLIIGLVYSKHSQDNLFGLIKFRELYAVRKPIVDYNLEKFKFELQKADNLDDSNEYKGFVKINDYSNLSLTNLGLCLVEYIFRRIFLYDENNKETIFSSKIIDELNKYTKFIDFVDKVVFNDCKLKDDKKLSLEPIVFKNNKTDEKYFEVGKQINVANISELVSMFFNEEYGFSLIERDMMNLFSTFMDFDTSKYSKLLIFTGMNLVVTSSNIFEIARTLNNLILTGKFIIKNMYMVPYNDPEYVLIKFIFEDEIYTFNFNDILYHNNQHEMKTLMQDEVKTLIKKKGYPKGIIVDNFSSDYKLIFNEAKRIAQKFDNRVELKRGLLVTTTDGYSKKFRGGIFAVRKSNEVSIDLDGRVIIDYEYFPYFEIVNDISNNNQLNKVIMSDNSSQDINEQLNINYDIVTLGKHVNRLNLSQLSFRNKKGSFVKNIQLYNKDNNQFDIVDKINLTTNSNELFIRFNNDIVSINNFSVFRKATNLMPFKLSLLGVTMLINDSSIIMLDNIIFERDIFNRLLEYIKRNFRNEYIRHVIIPVELFSSNARYFNEVREFIDMALNFNIPIKEFAMHSKGIQGFDKFSIKVFSGDSYITDEIEQLSLEDNDNVYITAYNLGKLIKRMFVLPIK